MRRPDERADFWDAAETEGFEVGTAESLLWLISVCVRARVRAREAAL
jgi:hypothetical protein